MHVQPKKISNLLKINGYVLDNRSHDGNSRRYYVDKNFFKKIDNKNKAYVLGLIISDGCIYKNAITFTSKDIELVEILKRELKSEHKLATYNVFDKRTNKYYLRNSLSIPSKEIINDLNNLGVFSKKSFDCQMPNIPEEYFWHFVRGIFDGDGTIFKATSNKEGCLYFSIIGSENLLTEIKNKFNLVGISNTKIINTDYKSNNGHLIRINYHSFHDVNILKNKIYCDSEDLRLSRKYDLFQTLREYKKGNFDHTKQLRQIKMYDLNNNFIKHFNNFHEVKKETGLSYKSIHRVAMGIRKNTKKYIFKYI
jgi:hypothetical protein